MNYHGITMEHSGAILFIEILGGALLALYLLRRITLTLIYCIILIKAAARAIRRQYRRTAVRWRHFRNYNPHGFLAKFAELIFGLFGALIPKFIPQFSRWLLRGYNHLEYLFAHKLCPAVYRRLPRKMKQFCDWILQKISRFAAYRQMKRRKKAAEKSFYRWQKRMAANGGRVSGTCPIRYLMPSADSLRTLAKK